MKALITGGTSGIGYGVARQLCASGWDVSIAGRNKERGTKIAAELGAQFVQADLSLMADVCRVAKNITAPLDALVLCAGVMSTNPVEHRTAEGYELAFATNYLGKFALSQMLLSKVPAGGCIVMVGGDGKHKGTLTDWTNPRPGMNAARTASLAVDIYASELAAREPHLRIHTCFPGVVKTNLFRTAPLMMRFYVKLFGTSIRKGSSPITALVTQRHEGVHWNRGIRMHFDPPLPSDNKRLLDYSQAVLENFKRQ